MDQDHVRHQSCPLDRVAELRSLVQAQRTEHKRLRRLLREAHAAAAAQSDASTKAVLRSRGLEVEPPVPSYVPDDLV